jgi:DNA-binding CsgD family transcriptional regulator
VRFQSGCRERFVPNEGNRARRHISEYRVSAVAGRVSSQLVGREDEIGRLTGTVDRVRGGHGAVVFLSGEPGIGKTRLAQWTLGAAGARGFLVLQAGGFPQAKDLPYALLIAAFKPALRRLNPGQRAGLARDLPRLGLLFSDLELPPLQMLGDSALEKTRLFEDVSRLLEFLAAQSPTALFLDDLHWADNASIEVLHYLARGISNLPVLILVAYLRQELDSARGLRGLVRDVERVGVGSEIQLRPLAPRAVADMAAALLGSEGPPELTKLLNARTGGTPMFIEALINELIHKKLLVQGDQWTLSPDASTVVPRSVDELIGERLERVGNLDRRVLDLVAVAGEAASHHLIKAVLDVDDDDLIAAAGRLGSAGLLSNEVIEGGVVYAVLHRMVVEVSYTHLPEMTRRHLHSLVASELEQLRPDDVERLAVHYRGAGTEAPRDRALEVTLAAAERARERYAHEEAARNYVFALALLRTERSVERMATVLERLGEAWERLGEREAAVSVWSEALQHHLQLGGVHSAARIRRRLAMVEWDRGRRDVAQEHVSAGIAAIDGLDPSEELADLYHARSVLTARMNDVEGMGEAAQRLLQLGDLLRSPRVLAEAHLATSNLEAMRGHLDSARRQVAAAVQAAQSAHDPALEQRAVDFRGVMAILGGDLESARSDVEESLRLARGLGAPPLEMLPRCRLVMLHVLTARLDEADRLSAETIALARRVGPPRFIPAALAVRSVLLTMRGELEVATALVAEARTLGSPADRTVFDFVDYADGLLALERGDGARATDLIGRMSELVRMQPMLRARLGEAQVAAGQVDAALETARWLAAQASGSASYAGAAAMRLEGLAHLARGELERAIDCLNLAAEKFGLLKSPLDFANTQLDLARAAAVSRPAEAASAAQESLDSFLRLGAERRADIARGLLRQLGVRPVRSRPPRAPGESLRGREREVAKLAAAGMTNQEIADRLIISVRTVTSHLDHIYSRLGIGSRAQLARFLEQTARKIP